MRKEQKLLTVIGYARLGAVDYAWRLLREAELDRIGDDPAVLCVVGRLLKDRAIQSSGEARRTLYSQAADAYARAGELNGATYPLINAATLCLLAGESERASTLATRVVAMSEASSAEVETPYYRVATLAEASLLLGDVAQAERCMAAAIEVAPRAYEDRASTIRQFSLILDALGASKVWLDRYRPPRCLHFVGHIGIAPDSTSVIEGIKGLIRAENIGFGFGALAAGADILVSEALLEAGAELHLVLPGTPAAFRAVSVTQFGYDWSERFDRILEKATTVRSVVVEQNASSLLSVQLAAEVAMGQAVMHANRLATEPVQLAILDGDTETSFAPGSSHWIRAVWKTSGKRQLVLDTPRVAGPFCEPLSGDESECLAAMLRIFWPDSIENFASASIAARIATVLGGFAAAIAIPRWTGEAVTVAFSTPGIAARVALAVLAALDGVADVSVAGHYGVVKRQTDPFGGAPILSGAAAAVPGRVLLSTPPGAVHVTEDFAAALYVCPDEGRPVAEYVGELAEELAGSTVRLFALRPGLCP